jgi:hypothetical protein
MAMKRQIISRRETVKLDPRGELERWVVFEYMLDNFGPFVFEHPKKTFTYDLLRADMEKEEAGLAAVQKP